MKNADHENVLKEEFQKYKRIFKLRPCHVIIDKVDLQELQKLYQAICTKGKCDSGKRSRQVVCYICLAKFRNSAELQMHKKLHEIEELTEESNTAITNIKSVDLIDSDVTKTSVENKSISITDAKQSQLVNNNSQCSDESNNPYIFKCTTCNSYFKSGLNLFDHVRENKGKACKFFCHSCNKMFNYPVEFSQHISKHLSVRNKKNDIRPLNTVTPLSGKYKCNICLKVFEDCFQLKRHYVLGHKLKNPPVSSGNMPPNIDENKPSDFISEALMEMSDSPLTCNLCFDEFQTKKELREHFILHMQLDNKKKNKSKDKEVHSNKNNEVIVIDDDDDHDHEARNKCLDVKEDDPQKINQLHSFKVQQLKIIPTVSTPGEYIPTAGSSLVTGQIRNCNPCPPVMLHNTNVRFVRPTLQLLNQPTQMLLLPGLNFQNPSTSQVKLLKTGPTSFQLCYENSDKVAGLSSGKNTSSNEKFVTSTSPVSLANRLSCDVPPKKESSKVHLASVPQSDILTVGNAVDLTDTEILANIVSASTVPSTSNNDISSSVSNVTVPPTTATFTTIMSTASIDTTSNANAFFDKSVFPQGTVTSTSKCNSACDVSAVTTAGKNHTTLPCTSASLFTEVLKCAENKATQKEGMKLPEMEEQFYDSLHACDPHNTDDGNESDGVGNLVIDEGGSTETGLNVVKTNTNDPSCGSDRPKIFLRKLSDLIEPEKGNKEQKEKKKQKIETIKRCTDCKIIFNKLRSLRLHNKKKHKCIKCDYQNCRVHTMKTHYLEQHDLFYCVRCKIVAESSYELHKHNEEYHKCPDCLHLMKSYKMHKPKCAGAAQSKK